MPQIWNFSAGPGMLPHSVLEAAQKEFLDYRGLGASIVEMSHRTHAVEAIVESLTEELRGLLSIPEEFEIFFTQGGGRTQFAMVPANLLRGKTGAYLVTGLWSAAALEEAKRIGRAEAAAREAQEEANLAAYEEKQARAKARQEKAEAMAEKRREKRLERSRELNKTIEERRAAQERLEERRRNKDSGLEGYF